MDLYGYRYVDDFLYKKIIHINEKDLNKYMKPVNINNWFYFTEDSDEMAIATVECALRTRFKKTKELYEKAKFQKENFTGCIIIKS